MTAWAEPIRLMNVHEIGGHLGLSRRTVDRAMDAGLFGYTYADLRHRFVPAVTVAELGRRPWVEQPAPPALILRPGPPQTEPDDSTRRFRGWHAAAPDSDRVAGIDRWLALRDAPGLVGRLAVVSVAGFVTDVYRIRSLIAQNERGAWHLELAPTRGKQANAYQGRRLHTSAGRELIRHRIPVRT